MRLLFRRRRRFGGPLLLPAIELLLLLLFLLRRPLLHRRRWPHQWMRLRSSSGPLLLLLRPEALIVWRPIFRHLRIPTLRRLISILSRRIALLLECPRLRVGHRSDLRIPLIRIA